MTKITIDPETVPTNSASDALRFCRELVSKNSDLRDTLAEECDLSIVVPVYNEKQTIAEFFSRLGKVLDDLHMRSEVIFVDDGSFDGSGELLDEYSNSSDRVNVVHLARNFGHQAALSAGLDYARGQATVIMDGDLQDLPESIPVLLNKWREGNQVVYAIRMKRKEGPLLRISYALFYRVLKFVADIDIPLDSGDFCLMDRKVLLQIRQMPERIRFLRGLRSWVGFKQTGVLVERGARYAGHPKYTWRKLFYLALDGLFSFSFKPLRLISLLGLGLSVLSSLLAVYYMVKRLQGALEPAGFATITVLVCFFAGVQLITLGLIGEYLGRVFEEVKRRPLFVVDRLVGSRFG